MKRMLVNMLAIAVMVIGLTALAAPIPPSPFMLADQACCGPADNQCCGDACQVTENGCEAKMCPWWKIWERCDYT